MFPYPFRIHHPICYTRTQSWSRAPNCDGYGSWITTKHVCTVYIIYWGASPERWHLSLKIPHAHTFYQALEEIVSQRIALKPRLFIHSYDYIQYRKVTPDYSRLRMATPDGYSGLLWTTPDGYSRLLRMDTPATGVLSALPKGQPGLGEATYQTSCLPCAGSFSLYDFRIRAGFPYIQRRGLLPMLVCGLRSHTSSHFHS